MCIVVGLLTNYYWDHTIYTLVCIVSNHIVSYYMYMLPLSLNGIWKTNFHLSVFISLRVMIGSCAFRESFSAHVNPPFLETKAVPRSESGVPLGWCKALPTHCLEPSQQPGNVGILTHILSRKLRQNKFITRFHARARSWSKNRGAQVPPFTCPSSHSIIAPTPSANSVWISTMLLLCISLSVRDSGVRKSSSDLVLLNHSLLLIWLVLLIEYNLPLAWIRRMIPVEPN